MHGVKVRLISRKNVLGTAHGRAVELGAAHVKGCVAVVNASVNVFDSSHLAVSLTDTASRTVKGHDKRRGIAVFAVRVGQTQNALALSYIGMIRNLVGCCILNLSCMIVFYLEINEISFFIFVFHDLTAFFMLFLI